MRLSSFHFHAIASRTNARQISTTSWSSAGPDCELESSLARRSCSWVRCGPIPKRLCRPCSCSQPIDCWPSSRAHSFLAESQVHSRLLWRSTGQSMQGYKAFLQFAFECIVMCSAPGNTRACHSSHTISRSVQQLEFGYSGRVTVRMCFKHCFLL